MAKKVKKAAKSKAKAKPAKAKASKKVSKTASKKSKPAKKPAKPKRKAAPQEAPAARLPLELDNRLSALAQKMDKTFEAVVLQALCEFADAWEDHFRTVEVMVEEDERIQIVVKPE